MKFYRSAADAARSSKNNEEIICKQQSRQDRQYRETCGSVRSVLDLVYGKVGGGESKGRKLYFVFQGAVPEKRMPWAGEYIMKRFAAPCGTTCGGRAANKAEAARRSRND